MPAPFADTRWILRSAHPPETWRAWSDETVLYDDSTGSTHLLAGLGGFVFAALRASATPLTPSEILSAISARLDLSELPEPEPTIVAALAEFEQLGIASPERT